MGTRTKAYFFACLSSVICSFLLLRCQYNDYSSRPKIRIINASPDAPSIDFQLNKKRKAAAISFGSASGYLDSTPGNTPISASPAGINYRIFYTSAVLEDNHFYTFIIDDSTKRVATNLLIDNRFVPAAGKGGIRFLHLVDNNESYDVSIGASVIFSNRTFNDIMYSECNYEAITAGPVTLDFRLAGTSSILFSAPGFNCGSEKLYTVVVYGSGSPGQKPGVAVYTDN